MPMLACVILLSRNDKYVAIPPDRLAGDEESTCDHARPATLAAGR